jgi:predicted metal-binding membrane protein
MVLAALVGALILPTNGKSVTILVVLAAGYLVVGVAFAVTSRGLRMNQGTESLQAEPV